MTEMPPVSATIPPWHAALRQAAPPSKAAPLPGATLAPSSAPVAAAGAAARPGRAGLEHAAREFASLMVQQWVASMRQGARGLSQERASFGRETFDRMMDEHLARALAAEDAFGLTRQVVEAMGGHQPSPRALKKS